MVGQRCAVPGGHRRPGRRRGRRCAPTSGWPTRRAVPQPARCGPGRPAARAPTRRRPEPAVRAAAGPGPRARRRRAGTASPADRRTSATDVALAEEIAARAALALDNVRLYDEARATAVALQRSPAAAARSRGSPASTRAQRYLPGSRDLGCRRRLVRRDPAVLRPGRLRHRRRDGPRAAGRRRDGPAAHGRPDARGPRPDARGPAAPPRRPRPGHRRGPAGHLRLRGLRPGRPRSLSYASAGHPPPVLQRPGRHDRAAAAPSGRTAGRRRRAVRVGHRSTVPDGARLVLYTDGLVESRDVDIDDGLRRLGRVARGRADRSSSRSATTSWPPRTAATGPRRRRRPAGGPAAPASTPTGSRTWQLDGGVESVVRGPRAGSASTLAGLGRSSRWSSSPSCWSASWSPTRCGTPAARSS